MGASVVYFTRVDGLKEAGYQRICAGLYNTIL